MANVIFTSSDHKYGDFLINHWLKSLKENSKLNETKIVVMDYGLTKEQKQKLKEKKVIVQKCKRYGHVTCIRWRDMGEFMKKNDFQQAISTDSGDIIFQGDITEVFKQNKDKIRAVTEDLHVSFEDFFTKGFFKKEEEKKIKQILRGKKMINAGFIVAPKKEFIEICEEFDKILINKNFFGPEQVAINYILYKKGFKELDKKYNFVITSNENEFKIKNGKFYMQNGKEIITVHNAGFNPIFRPIENFGYGKNHNKLKKHIYYTMRFIYKTYLQLKELINKK